MDTTFLLILALCLVVIAACVIAGIRNELVYRHRTKALNIIHESGEWDQLFATQYKKVSYHEMLCDLRKWTFADFYPALTKETP